MELTPKMTAFEARNGRLSTRNFWMASRRLPPTALYHTILHPPRAVSHPPLLDENRDSPERDMVNPSTDSYMWPIRGAPWIVKHSPIRVLYATLDRVT